MKVVFAIFSTGAIIWALCTLSTSAFARESGASTRLPQRDPSGCFVDRYLEFGAIDALVKAARSLCEGLDPRNIYIDCAPDTVWGTVTVADRQTLEEYYRHDRKTRAARADGEEIPHWALDFSWKAVVHPRASTLHILYSESRPNTVPVSLGETAGDPLMAYARIQRTLLEECPSPSPSAAPTPEPTLSEPTPTAQAPLVANPNPATEQTTIEFDVTAGESVTLFVADKTGKIVLNLYREERLAPGRHAISARVSELSPDLYFVSLRAGKRRGTLPLRVVH